MKSSDLFKSIFTLAVRLLGLVFLYLGLGAVPPLLDFGALETAGKSDLLNALLPIAFNLAVAWWLLGGGLLIRRAYPETSKILPRPDAQADAATSATGSSPYAGKTDAETAERKLASLVAKPKDSHAV